ncbi:MAG: integral rane sensor signal transduction histidine kinase [Actinomycetia bacterium]|jgi:signal transduction histidine kinase|nr:integral rane sensor signal transduction histidine kinase [Actinomycetes bacterium]
MCEPARYDEPAGNRIPAGSWAGQEALPADRLQLARELHDVVASGLATIALQASLAERVLAENPAQALIALSDIRRTSREALDELQTILGILRTADSRAAEKAPGATRIGALASAATKAGVLTDLTVLGERQLLPAEVGLAAYRIVQESLTNVLRHSQATSANVRLAYEPDRLLVEVQDDGVGNDASPSGHSHSHGILGMRERAAALGGELEARALPQGGFRVRASLPLGGSR